MRCDCTTCVNNKNGYCITAWMARLDNTGKCIKMSTDPADSFENILNSVDSTERTAILRHIMNTTYGAQSDRPGLRIHDMYPDCKLEDKDEEHD